jgi:hypothetical protein
MTRRRWLDWVLGIGLGLVIGLGVLVYFVFVHSEGAIDAPQVNEGSATTGQTTAPEAEAPRPPEEEAPQKPKPPTEQIPVVEVIGGAPPADSGPEQLTFHKGERVRFEIQTSEPFSFEIKGLGIRQSIAESSVISFPATKVGQFPVIATATLIGVADLQIKPPR